MTTSPASKASRAAAKAPAPTSTIDEDARIASTSRVIAAPRQVLFDLVADPSRHPDFDGSDTVKAPAGRNPERLADGAKFGMRMWRVFPYLIQNTVVEFEEGELLAWRHFHGHRWRYEFADNPTSKGGGTLVTESFDWSKARSTTYIELSGYPARNLGHMEATLERLANLVTA